MKTIIPLLLLTLLTACQTQPPLVNDPRVNPQMLSTNDLLKAQIEKMEKLERDMERREHDLKFQHMKELNQVQMQAKARSSECRFLCF
jgi:hypothetical protein